MHPAQEFITNHIYSMPNTGNLVSSVVNDILVKDINGDKDTLFNYIWWLDLTLHLAEIEHENNWDPYIKIYFNQEGQLKTICTEPGYADMVIDQDYVTITINDEHIRPIDISEIQRIEFVD